MFQTLKNYYHLLQALIANLYYGFPSREIKVIGITGTDGKTTTTHLIYHILVSAGKKVSMISTVYGKVGESVYDTGLHVTTPDSFLIQKMIRKAVKEKDEYFILETTSHAIDQNRVWGVQYEVGVLTNITHEHLDYHKTIDSYAHVKLRLINEANLGIVNGDDPVSKKHLKKKSSVKTYGLKDQADYKLDFRDSIKDLADFNAYNYLAAYAACHELGIADKTIRESFLTFRLPSGRVDIVYDKDFKVIIDFAHTPNAISRILQTVRKIYVPKGGKLIHIFGSAGLRDSTKRFSMGQASAQFADKIILTEEDYRTENPDEICRQIGEGVTSEKKQFEIIISRDEAIKKGISYAKKGDVVIITGKGHEKSLCRGKTEYPWSDKECALLGLKN